jgi:hypothetical protein
MERITIIRDNKEYQLNKDKVGDCWNCHYSEECDDFHCVSSKCVILGYCLGPTGKVHEIKECPFSKE